MKNKEAIELLHQRKADKESRRNAVCTMTLDLVARNPFIVSLDSIKRHVKQVRDLDTSTKEVTDVIKMELGMSFRKLRKISVHGNSTRNLVIR